MQAAIQPENLVGITDRGQLWTASRQTRNDRIIRLIEPQFCDLKFRQTLRSLREKHYPSMLPIVGEGLSDRFYIEYAVDAPWETLEAHFKRLHWRRRLSVISQICEVLPQWSSGPARPLGLNGRNIVMVMNAGRWFPWLLPCPLLKWFSPCDLFGQDAAMISALAPEIIRDVYTDERLHDSYALGSLAIHALGCKESSQVTTDEDRIEAQACGALLACQLNESEVETFLRPEAALQHLAQVIRRHTQASPVARPMTANELQAACAQAITATEPLALAIERIRYGRLREGLQMLEWGFARFGETFDGLVLAASISEQLEDLPQAVKYLDRAITLLNHEGKFEPGAFETLYKLCQQRGDLRWRLYQRLPPLAADAPDPEGDRLLEDLAVLKQMAEFSHEKNLPYKVAARVYRRRQDLGRAAQELYEAATLEPSDMEALLDYGRCLKDLGDQAAVAQLVQEAHRRTERMVINEMMHETEARRWRINFESLLLP